MLELDEVRSRLSAIEDRVREAHAAADVMAEGDASAAEDLSAQLDGMAEDVAALKAGLSTSFS
jgi:hypothetical protein